MALRDHTDQLMLPIAELEVTVDREPTPDIGRQTVATELIAYRGDPTAVDRFQIAKMHHDGLFGYGIYLTDSPIVAEDYAFASKDSYDHVFRNCKDDRDAVKAYMLSLMLGECGYQEKGRALREQITNQVYDPAARGDLDFATHHDNLNREYKRAMSDIALATMADAKRLVAERRDTIRFHADTLGNYRLLKNGSQGFVTSFSLPKTFATSMLDADAPLPDEALGAVGNALKEIGFTSFRHEDSHWNTWEEWVELVRREPMCYAWCDHQFGGNGINPSLDEVRNGTQFGGSAFHDLKNQQILSDKLEEIGYRGITFQGGVPGNGELPRGGGGIPHRVYVVWNEDYLHTRRLSTAEVVTRPILTAHEKHMRVKSFNL